MFFRAVLPRRYNAEMDPATRYTLRCISAKIMKIRFDFRFLNSFSLWILLRFAIVFIAFVQGFWFFFALDVIVEC